MFCESLETSASGKMGDRVLSPFVYWGQNDSHIFLKIDLKEVEVMVNVLKFNLTLCIT